MVLRDTYLYAPYLAINWIGNAKDHSSVLIISSDQIDAGCATGKLAAKPQRLDTFSLFPLPGMW